MSETRDFDLGDILTITTGRLVSRRHMHGVYEILSFLTGDSIYTHQIPRAMRACKPLLRAQLPQLADIVVPDLAPENYIGWLEEQERTFGQRLPVESLQEWQWESRNPITELVEMVGEDRVIAIEAPPSDA